MKLFKYSVLVLSLLGAAGMAPAQTISNPGFEANHFTVSPGYISGNSAITGWTASNNGRVGLNLNGINNPGLFVDNGAIPNGTNVAFIQATAGTTNTLSTSITGLTSGTAYRVSFRANHRSTYEPGTQDWSLNGGAFMPFTAFPAVGGSNPYYTNSAIFTATNTTAALVLRNGMATNGDATVLVDNFTIAVAVPLQVTNAMDGGAGSLRQVVANATANSTINFATNLAGTALTLTNQIILNKNLTIDASALTGVIVLNGNYATRIFMVTNAIVALNSLMIAYGTYSPHDFGGGAILNYGTLTLSNCTLTGNSAIAGGAIDNESGTLTLNNCTLANNAANSGYGGAIYNEATLTLNQCTLAGNTASLGGAINNDAGTLTLKACILAGNTAGTGPDLNRAGGSVTATSCLIGKADNSTITGANGNLIGSITTPLNALLAPLGYYGGLTPTMPPLPGSPAIDAAVNSIATIDQRGFPRTIDGNNDGFGISDIGAVEYQLVVVQNVNDSGAGSLRAAVSAPNDRIVFASALAGTNITLASQITLTKNVTIDASALVGGINLNGNHASRIFYVTNGISATLNSLTIINGYANNNYGGGIYNYGTLTLNQCTLTGNAAVSGGAIENLYDCTLTLNNCTLTGNAAGAGGAIENASGTLNLNQCTVTGNTANIGGAINNGSGASYFDPQQNSYVTAQGTATIYQSTLAGNTAASQGGAIYSSTGNSSYPAALTLNNSIVSGNTAPTDANLTLGDSSFSGANNLTNGVPRLATLGNYGGPTPTMPPLPGSPAIDAVASSTFSTDQRGFARIVGSAVDLGAVEVTQRWVVNTNDSGAGSLRQTLLDAPTGATVAFSNNLAGQTITLNSQIILTNSVIIDASTLSGGITLTGTNRTFQVNSGNTVTLNSLTFANGFCGGDGGVIYNTTGARLTLNNCTLTNNSAYFSGGAIYNSGTLTLNNCTLANNSGGGGTGRGGGAILNNSDTLTLNNCTLTGNSAQGYGGGVFNYVGTLNVNQCTVVGNSANDASYGGGGGLNNYAGTATVSNSIVAGNTAPANANISGSFTGANNLTSGDPKLAPLGNYGGPTLTMPPLPGSPAIDAATGSTATTDQRGFPRPVDGDGDGSAIPDIGAVEVAQLLVTTTNDSGAGSLRQVVAMAPSFAMVTFAPNLAGQTITLTNGKITLTNNVIIDASALPGGIILTGSNQVLQISSGNTVTLNSLTFANSFYSGNGGAIENDSSALTLNNCILTNNSASGDGGAIENAPNSRLTLNNCTLTGNSSKQGNGGAVDNYSATLMVNNCTFANNSANLYGGAIENYYGTATLMHCTLASNHSTATDANYYGGGAIDNKGSIPLTLTACILAGNTATTGNGPDLWLENGVLIANNCLIGNGTNSMITNNVNGNLVGTSAMPLNALLAPLGNYGGPTLTMPPLAGSPAIDAGGTTTLTTDQRGFPRVVGSAVDIGAVELQANESYSLAVGSPVLARALISAVNHTFQFSFTNTTGGSYRVLTSTNLTLPLANWSPVGNITETPTGSGQYQFIQTSVTNPAQFYRVVSP